ncbi:c-type cytochrome [bacterium]|nr:c-type cytochrome [bacterium]MBU1918535.1 c-type cytochrome [bacterium]
MNYPFWNVDIGYGVLMASIAVIHVFVSHFAIGGGLYLVVAETLARRNQDDEKLNLLKKLSKFFVLVSVVFGALTGVGIWFIIGLLNPGATEVLIHNYVWGWATEWTMFITEIAASILYYYGWKHMSGRNHIIIGWIYFIAAWGSLFVINGIITFMLTPGEWIQTGNFWDGFFNPTFWSTLWLRTGVCIMLAGLYSLLVLSREKASDFKVSMVRFNAIWGLAGLLIIVPTMYWYWHVIPQTITDTALKMMPTPIKSLTASFWNVGAIALLLIVFGFIIPRRLHFIAALVIMLLGLSWFGHFEWMRESIRKPYVITDYMYGNAVEVSKKDVYKKQGYLSEIKIRTGDDGKDLFLHSCRTCHTLDGYKPLKPAFNGTDKAFIKSIVLGAHKLKGNMPPFWGTKKEAGLIADHIYKQVDQRDLATIYGLSGQALGAKVYEVRCNRCHEIGGYNDKSEALLTGATEESLGMILDMAGELAPEMPAFTGNAQEKKALIEYLLTVKE